MRPPIISTLMPVYNCEETIYEAVYCIINQTYTDWELIIYDDASTDGTYKKAQELAEKDNRIRLFKNDYNLTLAPTLNKCLKKAKGDYIARMDGDDLCAQDRLEKEVIFLENNPQYSLVSCQMELFDDYGVYKTIEYKLTPQKEDFVRASQICHAGCMMRKCVLEELNGYDVSKEKERIEDYDLWVRMYEAGYKAYNLQEVLYSMRDDRNAIKRKKFKYRINEYHLIKEICKKFDLPRKNRLYALKPIVLGFLPTFVYSFLHKR